MNYEKHETEETAKIVMETFSYNPKTGVITRIKSKYKARVGKNACTKQTSQGPVKYFSVYVNRRLYRAHRVAWLLHYGKWPEKFIDHKDGNGLNNKIRNLRLATKAQNCRNSRRSRSNTSGVTGVSWEPRHDSWRVRIMVDGKSIFLGHFKDINDAIDARSRANKKYGFSEGHGKNR